MSDPNPNIGGWNVSNVDNFQEMFEGSEINNDLSGWSNSNNPNTTDMLKNAANMTPDEYPPFVPTTTSFPTVGADTILEAVTENTNDWNDLNTPIQEGENNPLAPVTKDFLIKFIKGTDEYEGLHNNGEKSKRRAQAVRQIFKRNTTHTHFKTTIASLGLSDLSDLHFPGKNKVIVHKLDTNREATIDITSSTSYTFYVPLYETDDNVLITVSENTILKFTKKPENKYELSINQSDDLNYTDLNISFRKTSFSANDSQDFNVDTNTITSFEDGGYFSFGAYRFEVGSLYAGDTTGGPICFAENTPIVTDQGEIPVQHVTTKNTIGGKSVLGITNIYNSGSKQMILIKKGAFDENMPSRDTYVTDDHGVFINNSMYAAGKLVDKETVVKVDMKCQIYNIVMEEHIKLSVNNMYVESLDPGHPLAKYCINTETNSSSMLEKFIQK